MGFELLLAFPGCPFQVIVLERMNEDFRLVQPRRIGGRIPRLPPPAVFGEVLSGGRGYVTRPAILDEEDTSLLYVIPPSRQIQKP